MDNENKSTNGSKKMMWIAVVVIVILLVAGYFVFGKSKTTNLPITSPSVATVNGVDIPKATYDTQLAAAIASYKTQGTDVTTNPSQLAQVKEQVLDTLINNELLSQEVKAAGITASSTQVDTQYQAMVTQEGGATQLAADLAKNNMTAAQLRANITQQLAEQTYLLQHIDVNSITTNNDEIAQFYAQYSASQKAASSTIAIPTLKVLSAQIKQQIISNKQQAAITSIISGLRAKATIATSTSI